MKKITHIRILWWHIFWRTALFGTLIGLALAFLAGRLSSHLGIYENSHILAIIAGNIGYVIVSYIAVKRALQRKHGEFMIQFVTLIPEQNDDHRESLDKAEDS